VQLATTWLLLVAEPAAHASFKSSTNIRNHCLVLKSHIKMHPPSSQAASSLPVAAALLPVFSQQSQSLLGSLLHLKMRHCALSQAASSLPVVAVLLLPHQ